MTIYKVKLTYVNVLDDISWTISISCLTSIKTSMTQSSTCRQDMQIPGRWVRKMVYRPTLATEIDINTNTTTTNNNNNIFLIINLTYCGMIRDIL